MKQLTALQRHVQPSVHRDPSAFCRVSFGAWWEMCSSGNRTRSVRPVGKYRVIRLKKISEIQTGIFGRMERALNVL